MARERPPCNLLQVMSGLLAAPSFRNSDESHSSRAEDRDRERELVVRVRTDDAHAFAELVERYLDRVTRIAYCIVRSHDMADDLAQDVFIRCWEQRAALDPERSIAPYLFRIVRNRAFDLNEAIRVRERYQQNVRSEAASGSISTSVPSPEGAVLSAATIQTAVNELPLRRQLAFRLRFEEELTHAEIAQVLGITPAAAAQLVFRAFEEVRQILRAI